MNFIYLFIHFITMAYFKNSSLSRMKRSWKYVSCFTHETKGNCEKEYYFLKCTSLPTCLLRWSDRYKEKLAVGTSC